MSDIWSCERIHLVTPTHANMDDVWPFPTRGACRTLTCGAMDDLVQLANCSLCVACLRKTTAAWRDDAHAVVHAWSAVAGRGECEACGEVDEVTDRVGCGLYDYCRPCASRMAYRLYRLSFAVDAAVARGQRDMNVTV